MLRVLDRQVGQYLEQLLEVNASRIESDFSERVLESRRRLEFEIRTHLSELVTSAERALARANDHRARGSDAVRAQLERLESLSQRLQALGAWGKETPS